MSSDFVINGIPSSICQYSWRNLLLYFSTLFVLAATPVNAIIIRHDRPDSLYVVNAREYPQLFPLAQRHDNQVCVGTLISPSWAITSAHCVEDTDILENLAAGEPYPLEIAGKIHHLKQAILHPDYEDGDALIGVDLALLNIDPPTHAIVPIRLPDQEDEAEKVVSLFGWGSTGLGTVGRSHNDGKFRRAKNRIEKADQWLHLTFDDPRVPSDESLLLEGMPGLGDSGGPALIEYDSHCILLGIAVGELVRLHVSSDSSHFSRDSQHHQQQGLYGAEAIYERISKHLPWINSITTDKTAN